MKVTTIRPRVIRALVISICVVALLIQPLRSVWLSLVLPRPWAKADAFHLYKVLTYHQNIPLDHAPMEKEAVWKDVQVNSNDLVNYIAEEEMRYPEFRHEFARSKNPNSVIKVSEQHTALLDAFQPLLNNTERARLMFAFDAFYHACEKAGLTYFMIEASLMGVIRHHGMIPWDDDIDVAMNVKDWVKIRNVLGNIEGFELFAQRKKHWKFYSTSGKQFKKEYHKFPYLDIFFYDEDDTHIWAVSKYLKHDLLFRKTDVFPLQRRPFENKLVPVPCNLDVVVHKSHDRYRCVTPEFIHKTNTHSGHNTSVVHCKLLYDVYPFVFQTQPASQGFVEEQLRVGTKELHTVKVPAGCAY